MVLADVWPQPDLTGRPGAWGAPHEQLLHLKTNGPMSVHHWLQAILGMWRYNFLGISGLGHSHQLRVILGRSGSCAPFTVNTSSSRGGEDRDTSLGKVIWEEYHSITTLAKGYNTSYSKAKCILQVSVVFPGCCTHTMQPLPNKTPFVLMEPMTQHRWIQPINHDSFGLPENMGIIQITNNHLEVNPNLTPRNINKNNNSV